MIILTFVPPMQAWSGLKLEAPENKEELIQYYEDTWLKGRFPVSMWNIFSVEGPHTNNHVEGWHNKMKKITGKPHLNIYT